MPHNEHVPQNEAEIEKTNTLQPQKDDLADVEPGQPERKPKEDNTQETGPSNQAETNPGA